MKIKIAFFVLFSIATLSFFPYQVNGQNNGSVAIGIGTPDPSSILDINANNKGLLTPRLTSAERDAIQNPADGLIIFNTTTGCPNYYFSGVWYSWCGNVISVYPSGTINCNGLPTEIVEVVNPSTGKTWMDRNLGARQVAFSVNDALAYGDLYQWGRFSDGHQCRNALTTSSLSNSDIPANGEFILAPNSPFDWRSGQNSNLWQGLSGTNNPCPSGFRLPTDAELVAERLSWGSNNSAGAFASPLKLPTSGGRWNDSGFFLNVGIFGYYWSSTISGSNARRLSFSNSSAETNESFRAFGFAVRCIKENGSIVMLDCDNAIKNGTILELTQANEITAVINYSGGNGGSHHGQSVNSTGVRGLTATLAAGRFVNGSGTLLYEINGVPDSYGTASFTINLGGQVCTLTWNVFPAQPTFPAGTVHCNPQSPTAVIDVINPSTGKTWMDRNLGASRVATSSTDAAAYGDLYQWGRFSDGHQCRNSSTTTTLSASDKPANGNFITTSASPNDWRNPQNSNLWQELFGSNNPCPIGYRLPTSIELDQERQSWSANTPAGAFSSTLKLPMGGSRNNSGVFSGEGSTGRYWTSNVDGNGSSSFFFNSSGTSFSNVNRAEGRSVRCLKDMTN